MLHLRWSARSSQFREGLWYLWCWGPFTIFTWPWSNAKQKGTKYRSQNEMTSLSHDIAPYSVYKIVLLYTHVRHILCYILQYVHGSVERLVFCFWYQKLTLQTWKRLKLFFLQFSWARVHSSFKNKDRVSRCATNIQPTTKNNHNIVL